MFRSCKISTDISASRSFSAIAELLVLRVRISHHAVPVQRRRRAYIEAYVIYFRRYRLFMFVYLNLGLSLASFYILYN